MPERWCDKRTDDETDAGMRRVTCIRTEQVTRGEESNVNMNVNVNVKVIVKAESEEGVRRMK